MKKATDLEEMADEYDFAGGVRGKYARRYAEGTNVVLLDPDVREFFPDSKAVNDTLRVIARIARDHRSRASLPRKPPRAATRVLRTKVER